MSWLWQPLEAAAQLAGEPPSPLTDRVFKRFFGPAQLSGAASTLYTVPAGTRTRILHTHVQNPSASAIDFTTSIGADAAATRVYDDYSVRAKDVKEIFTTYELAAGETIQAWAETPATLTATITGYEEPE